MTAKRVGITAVASYFPENIVTNDDLAKIMDTSDEWIRTRTGITQRHHAAPGVGASDLALPAAQEVLEKRGLAPTDIDCIIVATVTPDMLFPATACLLQHKLGATNAWGFDLSAACSSFLYALSTGQALVAAGRSKRCLVVGVDVMSRIINMEDRTTAVLFGDGAGVALLEEVDSGGWIDCELHIDGAGGQNLYMPAGGSVKPATAETVANKEHYVHQNGREVFKSAVREMAAVSVSLMEKHGYTKEDLALFIPHQANIRIIESAANRLNLPEETVMLNIDRRANTTSATLPSCMVEAVEQGRLKKGDLLLLATFGAGYTWGSALLEWSF
ncbi:3-oxoacyl-[acyl-carrier-protein] synthase 3 [Sulfidibacter corallicola]|uniref:Beta-ketoacyl-[acyl-carrier-protein] synthase III n=1 Tax=Sulfidibacter corallicola TaxID=2818388 RepID=A0A8A4TQU7_SULCO|nr:beta-ketoacyl-ACP synthase III [Sulfidibacter corallicola]QTD51787.1 ketoacyl-ACP synthase III [Sulfidibacter corallicola]